MYGNIKPISNEITPIEIIMPQLENDLSHDCLGTSNTFVEATQRYLMSTVDG